MKTKLTLLLLCLSSSLFSDTYIVSYKTETTLKEIIGPTTNLIFKKEPKFLTGDYYKWWNGSLEEPEVRLNNVFKIDYEDEYVLILKNLYTKGDNKEIWIRVFDKTEKLFFDHSIKWDQKTLNNPKNKDIWYNYSKMIKGTFTYIK